MHIPALMSDLNYPKRKVIDRCGTPVKVADTLDGISQACFKRRSFVRSCRDVRSQNIAIGHKPNRHIIWRGSRVCTLLETTLDLH